MSDKVSLKDLVAAERALSDKQSMQEVPDVSVPLPSKGKVYSVDNVLYLAEAVDVRALTAKDENILSSPALLKKGQALGQTLKACITNKLVDPENMIVGDRNAILIAMRNCSYGSEYPVEVECPVCEKKFEHVFDMSKLPLVNLEIDPIFPGSNAFRYILPKSKREVIFKLTTGRDITELNKTLAQLRKNNIELDNTITFELHNQLISIDGEEDRTKLMRLIEGMSAFDSMKLREYINDVTPGVDMYQTMTCPDASCGAEQEVEVPLGTDFFWPGRKRRRRNSGVSTKVSE